MQHHHHDHQHAAHLGLRDADHGPQVLGEEEGADGEADGHEHVVEDRDGAPADERDGDPDGVGVPVQRPAFDDADAAAAIRTASAARRG